MIIKKSLTLSLWAIFTMMFPKSSEAKEDSSVVYHVNFDKGNSHFVTLKYGITDDELLTLFRHANNNCWQSWFNLNACTIVAPAKDGYLLLESPWWPDPNHKQPLALLAYTYNG